MKNVYEVLSQKEHELSKVEAEVRALRLAARLLSDHNEARDSDTLPAASPTVLSRPDWRPQAVNASPRPTDPSQSEDNAKNWP